MESSNQTLRWGYAGHGVFQTKTPVQNPVDQFAGRGGGGDGGGGGNGLGHLTNLIINYLPHDMTESELRHTFSRFGEIRKHKIVRDPRTGKSSCYGFVEFVSPRQAAAAQICMDGYEVRDKRIKVSYARSSDDQVGQTNLYVAHLPSFMDEQRVRELFASYGPVLDVNVLRSKYDRQPRGVAFVRFEQQRHAEMAKFGLNQHLIRGSFKPLQVKFVDRSSKGGNQANRTSNGLPFKFYRQGNGQPPGFKRRQDMENQQNQDSKRPRGTGFFNSGYN
ncbi:sex-lethal homolog [Drosophila takahashii]|uniref:sex-lethal homolog n=1 Tax=Drosophila takahashii TaxID=29030 RepID=UPI0038993A6C